MDSAEQTPEYLIEGDGFMFEVAAAVINRTLMPVVHLTVRRRDQGAEVDPVEFSLPTEYAADLSMRLAVAVGVAGQCALISEIIAKWEGEGLEEQAGAAQKLLDAIQLNS